MFNENGNMIPPEGDPDPDQKNITGVSILKAAEFMPPENAAKVRECQQIYQQYVDIKDMTIKMKIYNAKTAICKQWLESYGKDIRHTALFHLLTDSSIPESEQQTIKADHESGIIYSFFTGEFRNWIEEKNEPDQTSAS